MKFSYVILIVNYGYSKINNIIHIHVLTREAFIEKKKMILNTYRMKQYIKHRGTHLNKLNNS